MSNKIISNAISAVLVTLCISSSNSVLATSAQNPQKSGHDMMANNLDGMEKCYGIAKAGQNDCATALNGCAGESKKDGEKIAWITLPKGVCNKIMGGDIKIKA